PDSKVCEACGKVFKYIQKELEFYRRMSLSEPTKCHDCRHKARMTQHNPRKLWKRNCMKCQKEIETSYSPERSEIVYCEKCYLETFY
ncbi:MAG: zinc-ribbon domain containing protein, partial [Candidatus Gracilibacteria bacterium]